MVFPDFAEVLVVLDLDFPNVDCSFYSAGHSFFQSRPPILFRPDLENQNLSMIEQKVIFEKTFDNWTNYPVTNGESFAQIDDVLVIGFKL